MITEKTFSNPKKEDDYYFRFGKQIDLDHPRPIIPDLETRFRHVYIVGKTGMGKSTTMENMAVSDVEAKHAIIYIDPKGTSVKKLYSLYPNSEYISIRNPKVINPIDKPEFHIEEVISEFVQILDILIQLGSSNVQTTVYMKEIIGNAIRIIDKPEHKNIKYLVKFLLYEDERTKMIPRIHDPQLKRYWKEFDEKEVGNKYPKNKDKIETAKRVASRLMEISQGRMEDFVVGRNEFDLTAIVQKQQVVLIDTSRMSPNARNYLSNLIVYAVLAYTEFLEVKPKPLMVYVDEFQEVVSDWFASLLARSRDKLVGFTLAHQSFAQIDKDIMSIILDNVSTYVCFQTGDQPANRLKDYFGVTAKELLNLSKHNAWIRIGTNNTLTICSPPFNVELISPPEKPVYEFLKDIWV